MKPKHLGLLLALAALSAGIDTSLVARPGRGWGATDVLAAWGIAFLAILPLLAPALLLGVRWPRLVGGLLVGGLAFVHLVVAVRFGALLNAPLLSPTVLGALLAVIAGCALLAFAMAPRVERATRPIAGAALALGAVGLLVGLVRVGGAEAEASARGPNVVLFTLDTFRADRLGAAGGRVPTPNLDRIAGEGAVFTQAIASAPQTGPSHLSLLTGRYPISTGVVANGTPIGDRPESIARVLRDAGWHTAAFVAAFPIHERFGFDQGFDVYDADFSPVAGLHDLAPVRLFDMVVLRNLPRERRGDAVNARVAAWLEDAPEPFFLWVHYYDPHGPYTAPEPFGTRFAPGDPPTAGDLLALPPYWPSDQRAITDPARLEAQYDAEVAWTDHLVGELLASVEARGLERELVVVATADHGESMTEHGILFDHGDHLHDTELRVPLLLRGPGVVPGTRVDVQVPTVDVAPTLLDLLHVRDAHARDGRSRARELRGEQGTDDDAFASTVGARTADPPIDHAIRRPTGKCIRHERADTEFFDLRVDPGERRNAWEGQGEALVLCEALDRRLQDAAAPITAETDAETQRALEALGYTEGAP